MLLIQRLQVWRDLRLRLTLKTLQSIYCKQNTEVTCCIWQLKLQTNVWSSWKPYPIQENPRPNSSQGYNQLTTSAVNNTWHYKYVENQLPKILYNLMQQIDNFEKLMVKSAGGELFSAFGTSKDKIRLLSIAISFACMLGEREGRYSGAFALFICKPIMKQYIRLPQCMGIF